MSKNRAFLLSIGCLFIMLSYMMPNPVYLIVTGIAIAAFALMKKDSKDGSKAARRSSR